MSELLVSNICKETVLEEKLTKGVNNCPKRCDYIHFLVYFCRQLDMFRWRSRNESSTSADDSKYGSTGARLCNYNSECSPDGG